jgi:hypothetical protein
MTLFAPTYLQNMVDWINNPNTPMYIRRDHKDRLEGGVDLASAGGTPVYALATGPIVGAGYFCHPNSDFPNGDFTRSTPGPCVQPGYGVVTQRVNIPGYGVNDLYYQHIDIDPSVPLCPTGAGCTGTLIAGQRIGTIHPGVNELEMGLNANWGTIWGPSPHPNAWSDDPRPAIASLMQNGGLTVAGLANPSSGGSSDISTFVASIGPKIGLFVIALVLVVSGFFLMSGKGGL